MLTIVSDRCTNDHGVAGEGMGSVWGAGGRALDLLEEVWAGVERHTHL